ncbi:protein of unknown function [Rhodovastum atsumiense]|nr:protein of unknown function [Rhodovastum atsumiense]
MQNARKISPIWFLFMRCGAVASFFLSVTLFQQHKYYGCPGAPLWQPRGENRRGLSVHGRITAVADTC